MMAGGSEGLGDQCEGLQCPPFPPPPVCGKIYCPSASTHELADLHSQVDSDR
jgi:hypothetical protein